MKNSLFLIFISDQAEKKATDLDKIYHEYKQNYKRLSEESNLDITDELNKILESDVFFENFELLLKSTVIGKKIFFNCLYFN